MCDDDDSERIAMMKLNSMIKTRLPNDRAKELERGNDD